MSGTYKGLVDRFGQPIAKAVLKRELAGPTLSGVRTPITGYPGDGLNPDRLAAILREADEGDPLRYLELAETIEERDLHYVGVLGTRRRSISQLDITVEAGSEAGEHQAQAEAIRGWLQRDELAEELFDILDSIGKGYSFTEILWDTSEGQWRPQRLEWRDPRWFRFARQDGRSPLLRTDQGDVPLQPGKFIAAVTRAKSGLPVRSGLARIVAWAWMFKAYTQRDWAIFTQTFGQPVRLGKYGSNASEEEKATLFRAVANIAGDCAAIIPETMLIEFIESKSVAASTDLYRVRSDWLDQQVSKAVLGQTATTDAIAGGHAVGREHRQVQEDIERSDAKALAAILNRDLIRIWVDLEYGPQTAYPRLKIGRPEETDIDMVVGAVDRLMPYGLRVPAKWMADLIGAPEPKAGEAVLEQGAAPEEEPAEKRSEGQSKPAQKAALNAAMAGEDGMDAIDAVTKRTEILAAAASDRLIDQIRNLVERAESLEAVQIGLLELLPDMEEAGIADALARALAFAELTGRSDLVERR